MAALPAEVADLVASWARSASGADAAVGHLHPTAVGLFLFYLSLYRRFCSFPSPFKGLQIDADKLYYLVVDLLVCIGIGEGDRSFSHSLACLVVLQKLVSPLAEQICGQILFLDNNSRLLVGKHLGIFVLMVIGDVGRR